MSLVAIPLTPRVKTATGTQTEGKQVMINTGNTMQCSRTHLNIPHCMSLVAIPLTDSYENTDREKTGYDTGITLVTQCNYTGNIYTANTKTLINSSKREDVQCAKQHKAL